MKNAAQKLPQHQCLIYYVSAAKLLPALGAAIKQRLRNDYRCIYLHSPAMVAAMRYSLSEEAVNVQRQIDETNLILSSEQTHLQAGRFDIDRMIEVLDDALNQALRDGDEAYGPAGDMSWEFGAEKDFSKLLEYEWRLEQCFSQPLRIVAFASIMPERCRTK